MKSRLCILIVILIAVCFFAGTVKAADKPKLDGFNVQGRVMCPDNTRAVCLIIRNGDVVYIVKGQGYGEEEVIWQIDVEKVQKANELTDPKTYLKLVWQKFTGKTV